MLLAVTVLFFLALFLAGYAITSSVRQREESQEQIKRRLDTQTGVALDKDEKKVSLLKDLRLSSIAVLNNVLGRVAVVTRLSKMMRQAGLNRRVGEIVLYIPLMMSIGVLLGMVLTRNTAISAICGMVGGMLPIVVVARMRSKRLAKFSEQLPDALDLMKAALQAGHSFIVALKVVAEEFPSPVSEEFDTVAEEMRLGLPMRDALQGLEERVADPNVPVLIVGVLVVNESGGNMVEVLENIAHTVRERFKLLRDVQVMTAQGRLSGGLLACLPVVVALVIGSITPSYFDPMIETQTGHFMIAYAVGSILLGHLMIQRIVKIKV